MERVQLLIPIEPNEFWQQLKVIVEEAVSQKSVASPHNNHVERPLLKAKEVCEIFQISKPTIYDWLKKGRLNSVKIQSRRFFRWKDVEGLIESNKESVFSSQPLLPKTRKSTKL
jgi:excisionase family DNA binding protein